MPKKNANESRKHATKIRKHNDEKSKSMELPRHVTIGHGVLENIGEICKSLHIKGPAMIIVDKNTKRIAGNKVEKFLQDEKYETQQVIIDEANLTNLEKVKARITETKTKLVLLTFQH